MFRNIQTLIDDSRGLCDNFPTHFKLYIDGFCLTMALSRTRQKKHVFLYKTTIRRTDIGTSKSLSTPKLISMDFFTLGEFKDTNISTTSHTKIPTSDSVPPTSQLSSVHSIHIQTLLQNPPRKSHRESKTTIVFVQSSQTHSSHPFSSQTKTPPISPAQHAPMHLTLNSEPCQTPRHN